MDGKRREKTKKSGILQALWNAVESSLSEQKGMGGEALALGVITVALGFLFAGTHTFFGAYPLGLALVTALPRGVWLAALGVAVGSISLGKIGIVPALICLLSVLLRIVISGVPKENGEIKLFSESVPLRLSCAAIGASVASIYEILTRGVSGSTLLYSCVVLIFSVGASFILSGLFWHGYGLCDLIFGKRPVIFTEENEPSQLVFRLSSLFLIFLVSLSLKRFNVFGVNFGFVFSGAVTLFASLRFGTLCGTVVGFVSSVGLSAVYSVAFALGGAACGLLLPFGKHLAIVGALVSASVFGAYTSGTSGFLSVLPEFSIASFFILPLVKYLEKESKPENKETDERRANDMVGTMALSYRNGSLAVIEDLENGIKALLDPILAYLGGGDALEDMTVFAKLLEEAREGVMPEREMDEELTDRLEAVLYEFGLGGGVVRAFGRKRKYIILAARDRDGTTVTSPALKRRLEEASGYKLGEFDYYRRDDMAMMVCKSVAKYEVSIGVASSSGRGEISGDTVIARPLSGGVFAILISDGMGSGEEAKMASSFVGDVFSYGLGAASASTLIHVANTFLRRKGNECSATLDLFCFDTVTGESCFYKSGAASSFIKRKKSLYRIKSETMPLGIINSVDAERISATVTPGDIVIALSDGVLGAHEDSAWFIELLNTERFASCRESQSRADLILSIAKEKSETCDDMTVAVAEIKLI